MSDLVSYVVLMNEFMEKNQATATKEKQEKKKRFTTMPPFYQSVIFISINHRIQISGLKHHQIIQVYPWATFTLVSDKHDK